MFQNTINIFGLDISDRALRLARLTRSGKKITLVSIGEITLEAGLFNTGTIVDEAGIITAIKKLLKSAAGDRIKTSNVISALPEAKTFIKEITISPKNPGTGTDNEVGELVRSEIVNHVPMTLEEVYMDWQVLHRDTDKLHVIIGAAPKVMADHYVSLLEKANLTPYVLEIEAQSIVRALFPQQQIPSEASIIIDFGAIRTGLILHDHASVKFTISLPISGNNITNTISKILKLDPDKAEEAKVVCGLDPEKCEGALLKILTGSVNDLAEHVKKAATFYKDTFPEGREISQVILCGGGANFLNIDAVLSSLLNIPVIIGNPLTNITSSKVKVEKEKLLSYTTAIGLALRGVIGKEII